MNKNLQTVDLESNSIGDAGATGLAEALKISPLLLTIFPWNNVTFVTYVM